MYRSCKVKCMCFGWQKTGKGVFIIFPRGQETKTSSEFFMYFQIIMDLVTFLF